jgi:hypothetical protein
VRNMLPRRPHRSGAYSPKEEDIPTYYRVTQLLSRLPYFISIVLPAYGTKVGVSCCHALISYPALG